MLLTTSGRARGPATTQKGQRPTANSPSGCRLPPRWCSCSSHRVQRSGGGPGTGPGQAGRDRPGHRDPQPAPASPEPPPPLTDHHLRHRHLEQLGAVHRCALPRTPSRGGHGCRPSPTGVVRSQQGTGEPVSERTGPLSGMVTASPRPAPISRCTGRHAPHPCAGARPSAQVAVPEHTVPEPLVAGRSSPGGATGARGAGAAGADSTGGGVAQAHQRDPHHRRPPQQHRDRPDRPDPDPNQHQHSSEWYRTSPDQPPATTDPHRPGPATGRDLRRHPVSRFRPGSESGRGRTDGRYRRWRARPPARRPAPGRRRGRAPSTGHVQHS